MRRLPTLSGNKNYVLHFLENEVDLFLRFAHAAVYHQLQYSKYALLSRREKLLANVLTNQGFTDNDNPVELIDSFFAFGEDRIDNLHAKISWVDMHDQVRNFQRDDRGLLLETARQIRINPGEIDPPLLGKYIAAQKFVVSPGAVFHGLPLPPNAKVQIILAPGGQNKIGGAGVAEQDPGFHHVDELAEQDEPLPNGFHHVDEHVGIGQDALLPNLFVPNGLQAADNANLVGEPQPDNLLEELPASPQADNLLEELLAEPQPDNLLQEQIGGDLFVPNGEGLDANAEQDDN